ncbi:amylo-alpha-1,6-glucosidase [Montanilutibacter psychrotolerans]|uniref:Amylo-alpha-1,6-glucosidase n=1 Tax=Montanilutibacter psychrotolerans TaxID=1327343 RepID=A0A3M8SX83_9GAMM|nr:amylo-alpha-1,6-glucosidase [Lysobacter psychrotolerans]RNF83302.1 amylo-alpha-1,6-glucosidase [Lysobacter psychrotolerans]
MDPAANAALYTRHVLKDGDCFLIANGFGDIAGSTEGLFRDDTRLLSLYRLSLGNGDPALLSASVSSDNVFFVVHLTNRALSPLGEPGTPQGLVHIARTRLLSQERMYERISCTNYDSKPAVLPLRFELAADFRDMFEVRGSVRKARGEMLASHHDSCRRRFQYLGLDGVLRSSFIAFSQQPVAEDDAGIAIDLRIEPGEHSELYVEAGLASEAEETPSRERFRQAGAQARVRMRHRQRRGARISSNGPLFDEWMRRSRSDLALLTSELNSGPYPYAGIPWFSTPFGRDAVVTALQTLWLDPGLARGVLQFLADHQAQEESAFLDSAPGKIMHETRKGEMSSLRELPFGLYYGGVDTTPLFVMLAGAYARRTGDHAFIERLWPALRAATAWIERVCDASPWGLLDYARREASGLSNQGWKDSEDSVFHADGHFAVGPIALIEVQGYAFAAFRAMAELGRARGEPSAAQWDSRADRLRDTVQAKFWMPAAGYYGIALDGNGRLCEVRASNPGHLLYVGLPDAARAQAVAEQLMSPAFYTGWGLRTLAKDAPRYNPMSYHNGSVWPHDSALCASGIAQHQGRDVAARLLRSAFEAAVHFDMRLPELYCGFTRRAGAPPIPYPVACLPQAWAAGSPFMLLQACLGVEIDGEHNVIHVDRPHLPPGIDDVRVRGLIVGQERVDLVFKQFGGRVGVFTEGRHADAIPVNLRS